jgi:hypothetical protein
MRTFAFTLMAALAVGTVTPTLAAKSTSNREAWRRDQASDPQSFQSCFDLAKQRGYSVREDRSKPSATGNTAARKFVEGCMAGRFR